MDWFIQMQTICFFIISIYQPVFRSSETWSVVSCAGSVVLSEDLVGNSEIKVKNLYH